MEQIHNPIKMVREIPVGPARLWKALTDEKQLKAWYFDFGGNFSLVPGHTFEWLAGPEGEKPWLHRGKITEVIPEHKLSHSWEYPGYTGKAMVSWELKPAGDEKTLLKFEMQFEELFDPSQPELARNNFVAGWDEIINLSLPRYPSGNC